MLSDELNGIPYNKSAHNDRLRAKLAGRSKAAVELKHANISAVLNRRGLRYIPGYKPRGNYQALLYELVGKYLTANPLICEELLRALVESPPPATTPPQISLSFIDPAPPEGRSFDDRMANDFFPRKLNPASIAQRDAINKSLGEQGEFFVVQLERLRLQAAKRQDLADKVRWVAKEDGDGAGYDVLSWELTGQPRHIEVKTTNAGALTPFFITENERKFSESSGSNFYLYRVYSFRSDPRVFLLPGLSTEAIKLEPIAYRARLK